MLLPPLSAPYLADLWREIGPVIAGGEGEGEIGWTDMRAWEELTGISLLPWEARAIRRASREFLFQRDAAREPGCPEPYDPEGREEIALRRDRVSKQFEAMIQSVKAQQAPDPKKRKD